MTYVNDKQEGGDHYKNTIGLQLWDFIDDNNIPFLEANVLKYVIRYKHKNGLQDLKKAAHYLEKIISQQEKKKRFTNYDELDFVEIVGAYDLDGDQIAICKAVIENRYPAAQHILRKMINELEQQK